MHVLGLHEAHGSAPVPRFSTHTDDWVDLNGTGANRWAVGKALTTYYNKFFMQCSKAFIKLEAHIETAILFF